MQNRLEKKFIYNQGDTSYEYFVISGMFRKTFPKRFVNSIYLDTEIYQDVYDNINGLGKRKKIRMRWYNNLLNSDVFLEEKKKIGFITQKKIEKVGTFKNFDEFNLFIKNQSFIKSDILVDKKINLKETLFIQYERNYYETINKKLRLTIDNNLKIFQKFPSKYIEIDKSIVELKYKVEDAFYVNNFIKIHLLNNRNQKYSKYVYSFIEKNENGFI